MKTKMKMKMKIKILTVNYPAALVAGLAIGSSPLSAKNANVTNSGDSGAGTFRAAVEEANADASVSSIRFSPNLGAVALQSSVTYSGGQNLSINGRGAVIEPDGDGSFDLLVSDGGGDLSLRSTTFQNSGAAGIYIDVPDDATGMVRVALSTVTLADNGLEGILIDDYDGPDLEFADGGSDAGIDLKVSSSTITGNGRSSGVSDIDAIRINERGAGDVLVSILNSNIDSNGGDGLEVEEGHEGMVGLTARNSTFDDNGDQDPDDVEDGIDIDERGEGDVVASFVNVSATDCFDEGIDLNEDDGGDINAQFIYVDALGAKGGDGLRCRENGDGNVFVDARHTTANECDDEGIQLSEEGEGNLIAFLNNVESSDNADHGIQLEEADGGSLGVQLDSLIVENNDDDGIQMEEADDGNFVTAITNSAINYSAKFGIKAEQGDDGSGLLILANVDLLNNVDGELEAVGIFVLD